MNKIKFLGFCSNSFGKINTVSFLYDNGATKLLVDCGPATLFNIKAHLKSLEEIEYVFISHSHFDHFLGLPYLLIGRNLDIIAVKKNNPDYIAKPLTIFLPSLLIDVLKNLLQICHSDIKQFTYSINYIPLEEGIKTTVGDDELIVKEVLHTVESYGFRLESNGLPILGYTADTLYDDALVAFFKGTKTLIAEGMIPDEDILFSQKNKHATFSQVTTFINSVSPISAFIVHLQPKLLSQAKEISEAISTHTQREVIFPSNEVWYELHL